MERVDFLPHLLAASLVLLAGACGGGGGSGPAVTFVEVAVAAGIDHVHADVAGVNSEALVIAGGVAAGDYDGDGDVDLYVIGGSAGTNRLYRNRGDGTFEEVGAQAGVAITGVYGSGPSFCDFDGDGDLDLFVGAVNRDAPVLFRNEGDGTFTDVTADAGLLITRDNTFSSAWGDYDGDGDLDLFLSHWREFFPGRELEGAMEYLWRNNGDGTFTDVSQEAGLTAIYAGMEDFTFTPNFADYDNDGDLDVLMAGDFNTSRVLRNNGDGTFEDATTGVFTDENGMGAAVADYDQDGDLDWFVTSIHEPDPSRPTAWGQTGNRMYRNRGDGTFEDATDEAGVRLGFWGWGASFADLDNDGDLDLVHANGWPSFGIDHAFHDDPARVFLNDGSGRFTEVAADAGVVDRQQGRGLVCFDADGDGDLDLFLANNRGRAKLFRNDGPAGHWLRVVLQGRAPNTRGIGARVFLTAGGATRFREIRAGSNFVSNDPARAHFGLGGRTTVDRVRVAWPSGAETVIDDPAVDRVLVVAE